MALIRVRHPFSVGPEFLTPNKGLPGKSSTRSEFPFRFGGQSLMGPFCIGFGVSVCNLDHGIVFFSLNGALGSGWVSPVRAGYVIPPLKVIIQRNRMVRRGKDHAARDKIFRRCPRKIFGTRSTFGNRDVPSSFHELAELPVGYVSLVHEKTVYIDSVDGPRVAGGLHPHHIHVWRILRAHRKFAAWNPDHPAR